ncbi:MAG: hypothetical protein L6V81_07645 [Clostridium sp.]|nr:MAG: hypothetical protein L6V81_07645 [Clostridium sp.]
MTYLIKKICIKKSKKGIFLSQYQCEVLQKYNINPYECSSINELIFMIDEVLEDESDADDLDGISREISEFNYYANTNK